MRGSLEISNQEVMTKYITYYNNYRAEDGSDSKTDHPLSELLQLATNFTSCYKWFALNTAHTQPQRSPSLLGESVSLRSGIVYNFNCTFANI